jgi:CheY-like chemotaxis protein
MRILYLEDEPNDAMLVELYVKTTSHDLVVSRTIDEARQALDEPPGLIMIDVVLHDIHNGYEFARELRSQGYDQPMIAVTGLATPHDIEDCENAGFNGVLHKPFTINQLVDVINHYTA